MIRIAICDDEPVDRARLRAMLADCKIPFEISEYQSGEQLVWDIETDSSGFDLYFLDIYMGDLNGVDVARRIRLLDEEALIIFVTSSEEFYKDSYDLFAFNYLTKPLVETTFGKILGRALKRLQQDAQQILRFTYRAHSYSLKCSEIDFITSENRLLIFHLHNGETCQCYGKLDELQKELPANVFLRCHQSYFVNLNRITALGPKGFQLRSTFIPISRFYSETAREQYQSHLFGIFE